MTPHSYVFSSSLVPYRKMAAMASDSFSNEAAVLIEAKAVVDATRDHTL